MTRQRTQRLARWATAIGIVVFARSLAAHHPDPATAAESGYLALLAGLVFLGLALAERATAPAVGGALAIVPALCLPAVGGTRGALVSLLLVAAVVWASWRSLGGERPGSADLSSTGGALTLAGLLLCWQTLLAGPRLFDAAFDVDTALRLAVLPLAAAGGAVLMARHRDGASAWILAAALLPLAPGADPLAASVLLLVAACLADSPTSWPHAALILAASVVAVGSHPDGAWPILVLVTAAVWRRRAAWRWLPAVAALVWALIRLLAATSLDPGGAGWLLVALPVAAWARPSARPLVAAALALGVGAGAGGSAGALAAAVGLLVIALPDASTLRRGQALWSLLLLGAAALLRGYPWLRTPLAEARTSAPGSAALALGAAVVLGAWLLARWPRLAGRGLAPVAVALGILLAAGGGSNRTLLSGEPVVLTRSAAAWSTDLAGVEARQVVVDVFLLDSGELAAGDPVAIVRLAGTGGARRALVLRLGVHTADWAAERLGQPHPEPWLAWVAPDGSLARRYRVRWKPEPSLALSRLSIVRHPSLPRDTRVALVQVGLR